MKFIERHLACFAKELQYYMFKCFMKQGRMPKEWQCYTKQTTSQMELKALAPFNDDMAIEGSSIICYSLPNRKQNVQVCDATDDDSSNAAQYIIITKC